MARDLLHPRMLGAFANTMKAEATIQAPTPASSASGAQTQTFTDIVGLEGISCAVAEASDDEIRAAAGTYGVITHVIVLAGRFDSVIRTMRVRVGYPDINDPQVFDIQGSHGDSQGLYTRLLTRLVA